MERITTDGKHIIFNGEKIATAKMIIADSTESVKSGRHFYINGYSPHRIDYILAAGNRVVGIESKTIDDLIGSWLSKRLARQLDTLKNTTDLPVLMLRVKQRSFKSLDDWPGVRYDLTQFQLDGGLIVFARSFSPFADLDRLRTKLAGGQLTERPTPDKVNTVVEGSVREQNLQLIEGVGIKTARKLANTRYLIYSP